MVYAVSDENLLPKYQMLALICFGVVCSMTPWFAASAILPELKAAWDMSTNMASILTNAVQAGFVVGALGVAFFNIADIFPSVRLMTVGAAVASFTSYLIVFASNAEEATVLRFITGIALALVYPPAMKLTTTWFVRGRGFALGLVIGGLTLGSAMPYLLRTLTSDISWQAVVMGAAIISLIGSVVFLALVREGPFPYSNAPMDLSQAGRVFKDRPISLANLGYFGHMWELYAMWAWFLVYVQAMLQENAMGDVARMAPLLVFVTIAAGIGGAVLGGVLADKVGRTLTTAGMMVISGTCAALVGVVFDGPIWLFVVISIIWGITIIGDSAQFSAMVTEVADRSLVGTALAVQMGIGFLITIVSIQIIPLAAEMMGGWRWAFLVVIPGPIIGTIAVLKLRTLPDSKKIAQGRR